MNYDFRQFNLGHLSFVAVNPQYKFVQVAERHMGKWHNPVAISSPELLAVTTHASALRQALGQAMTNALEHISRMEQGGAPLDLPSLQHDRELLQICRELLTDTNGQESTL